MTPKFFFNKLFRCLSIFLLLNSSISPAKSSSALAAWILNSNGILELSVQAASALDDFAGEILEFKSKKIDKQRKSLLKKNFGIILRTF